MNVRWALAALAAVAIFSSGCEPFTTDDDEGEVKFVNRSSFNVSVEPKAVGAGWSGFRLAPGEEIKIKDVYDVYFTYEPRFRVDVGENKNGRVLFVNASEETVKVTTKAN